MTETNTAREFWIREPGRGEIRERSLGDRPEGAVRVRTLFSGISRGTESLVFRGEVPPSQRQAMRAPFQEGDFPGPVKYGYMSVGRVVEAPEGAEARTAGEANGGSEGRGADGRPGSLLGRTVFCLYPHQDLYDVPASAVTPVPEGVPAGRGILAAQMETAVNVVWDGGVTVGDRVVVVGAGAIGLLVAWLCRGMPGARVTAVDPDPRRREAAQALGVELASTSPDDPRADVVVHASGQADGLRDALALVGRDGTLVEASWFGSREVALPLGEDFHARRIRLRSSQVGHVPPERAARWSRERRRRLALSLLADDTLDALVSGESDFDDLPTVMAELAGDGGGTLCHRIRYPAAAR